MSIRALAEHKEIKKRICLHQFFNTSFPIGSFQHSYGLETYIALGKVYDECTLTDYIRGILKLSYAKFDGMAFAKAFELGRAGKMEELIQLDEMCTCMRTTDESRRASLKTGKSMLRLAEKLIDDSFIRQYQEMTLSDKMLGNYPVVAGSVSGKLDVLLEDALAAYLFCEINNLVQVAVKIVPMGQAQGQKTITLLYDDIALCTEQIVENKEGELSSFMPLHSLMCMKHEELYSRLYMS